jgi:undecaprenyl-diphosphatase
MEWWRQEPGSVAIESMDTMLLIILAVVQGIAEFLPISSSGHLAVLEAVFAQFGHSMADNVAVTILLHAGTLAAVLIVYWRRILALLGRDRRMIAMLILGTIPAVLVGLPVKLWAEGLLDSPLLSGLMFPVTGCLLMWSGRRGADGTAYSDIRWQQALMVGLFQAVAVLPGISRSGSTIAGGLLCGMKRDAAAAFSFMLSIPVTGGACILQLAEFAASPPSRSEWLPLALATAVSMVVGLMSLTWLLRFIHGGRLYYFSWWLFLAGGAVIAWQLVPGWS